MPAIQLTFALPTRPDPPRTSRGNLPRSSLVTCPMRSSTDASLLLWPKRICRPWLVASAAGLVIGALLLRFSAQPRGDASNSFIEAMPRAAVYDRRVETSLSTDPFAPAPTLAAPPDEPRSAASEGAAPAQASPSAAAEFAP